MREQDYPTLSSAPALTSGSRRHSTTECRLIVAETSYHMLEILLLCDRERS